MSEEQNCKACPEGTVLKDGKCVLPDVTFSAFIMSLNTSALYHLGEIADPATGKKERDLTLAKHAIDTLKLLQEKTSGNLTAEEKGLLEDILFDLKLRYVKVKQG
jgi:hypothetical protein